MKGLVNIEEIVQASQRLKGVASHTALMYNHNLSEKYECDIYLKREDLQVVRSYKIRGAYNFMASLSAESLSKGVVCASAGNHAQGVAFSCSVLKVHGKIFMPSTTPNQKVKQVRMFGGDFVEVVLKGDTFDDAYNEAIHYASSHESIFIHPFDDPKIIEGQATLGVEILNDIKERIDYLILPVGGGGCAAGVGYYFNKVSPGTKIVGVEPEGAPSMFESLRQNKVVTLDTIEKFVDGAAVKKVGELPFSIFKEIYSDLLLVPTGSICSAIIKLYNEEAIVAEPAGALSIAALEQCREQIKGKTVVCLISGGNNDLDRMPEIKERSLIYEGLKHYFIIRFPQRAGALREFLDKVLGPNDDITRFEYAKKNIKDSGPAVVGIELQDPKDYEALLKRMENQGINYTVINDDPNLFDYLV